jgi:hypothetical protein
MRYYFSFNRKFNQSIFPNLVKHVKNIFANPSRCAALNFDIVISTIKKD